MLRKVLITKLLISKSERTWFGKGHFLATENGVNGYAPEKGTLERVCSGIWNVLFQFVVFSSSLIPVFRANEHEKRGFK
jgi:hypothetical protein